MCSAHAKNKGANKLLTRNPKEKRLSGLSKSKGEDNIKVDFKKNMLRSCALDLSGSRYEHRNESSVSGKQGQFVDQLSDSQLPNTN